MTRELAGTMAKKLVENSNTTHSIPVLAYGIEIMVNGLIKIIALTLLGWAMGMVKEIYVMAFIFGTFRMITGGVHAQTFGRCFTISLGSFAVLTFLIPFTNEWFLTHAGMIFFLSTVLGFFLIFKFVPGIWKGRIYNEERVRNSKWLAILFLFIILTFAWFVIHQTNPDLYTLSWAAFLGLFWQMFLVTPLGYRFIAFLEGTTTMNTGGDMNV